MKSIYFNFNYRYFLLFLSGLVYFHCYAQEGVIKADGGQNVKLFAMNFCEYHSQLIINNGDVSMGIHPSIGWGGCSFNPFYYHIDSLLTFNQVSYFEMDNSAFYPTIRKAICLGNENQILSFGLNYDSSAPCDTPRITSIDTLIADSISGLAVAFNYIAVIRETFSPGNFIVYDSILSSVLFSIPLNFKPIMIEESENNLVAVIGIDTNNNTVLSVINIGSHSVIKDTTFGSFFSNPIALKFNYQTAYIVCQPGDSTLNILEYNINSGNTSMSNVFTGSPVRVTGWGNNSFSFQPTMDSSGNGYDKKLFVINISNLQLDSIYDINKKLKLLSYQALGFNEIVFAVEVDSLEKIYVYQGFNYSLLDSINTGINPAFFLSDFRCSVSINEYDDSKVEWNVFPNPSNRNINLVASGLICGKDYLIDIVDMDGKIEFTTTLHAKMNLDLPVENLKSGIYFIRIHSLKGMVVLKFVKIN